MCLFVVSFSTNAVTSIANVDCPNNVELGQVFEVEVKINYPSDSDCLHGTTVYLYYGTPEPIMDFNHIIITVITDLSDYPQPSSLFIKVHSSDIGIVGDTVGFMVKVVRGTIIDGVNTNVGPVLSDICYTTIIEAETTPTTGNGETETNGINISFTSIIIPILILSVIVIVRKKKIKN